MTPVASFLSGNFKISRSQIQVIFFLDCLTILILCDLKPAHSLCEVKYKDGDQSPIVFRESNFINLVSPLLLSKILYVAEKIRNYKYLPSIQDIKDDFKINIGREDKKLFYQGLYYSLPTHLSMKFFTLRNLRN